MQLDKPGSLIPDEREFLDTPRKSSYIETVFEFSKDKENEQEKKKEFIYDKKVNYNLIKKKWKKKKKHTFYKIYTFTKKIDLLFGIYSKEKFFTKKLELIINKYTPPHF